MKDVCIDVLGCRALGDTLAVTPTLRKLYNSYGKKISVATNQPEIFKNNPYVDNIFNEITNDIKNNYEVFVSFNIGYHPNGVCYKHNAMDIRQFHAVNLGFMLTKDEILYLSELLKNRNDWKYQTYFDQPRQYFDSLYVDVNKLKKYYF